MTEETHLNHRDVSVCVGVCSSVYMYISTDTLHINH